MTQLMTDADLAGRLAVITGGGDGIGQALAHRLTGVGCHVAFCDISDTGIPRTIAMCEADAPAGTRITGHRCDVSDETQLKRFRDELLAAHETDHVNLVFLNAGIAGGGSMITAARDEWEKTFSVCWNGVYLGTRVFLPLLIAAEWGRIVTTSSVNGFFASLGPTHPHTAYSAAKFAVKGFTEALITDLAVNAPHVGASVVMPGHIGTGIAANTLSTHGADITAEMAGFAKAFREGAPTTSASAADIIMDGVLAGQWRILVGDDAHKLDAEVRANPEAAYDPAFAIRLIE